MSALAEKIRRLIRRQGAIPFRDFMEMALYDPDDGYYTRSREIGPKGDYYTSANIDPIFGQFLAERLAALLTRIEQGAELTVIEVGAGTGQLAEDVLQYWRRHHPGLLEKMSYVISERSPSFRLAQQQRLSTFPGVLWKEFQAFEPNSVSGVIFSNELIDSFPIHRVVWLGEQFQELFVDWREERFVWVLHEPSVPELFQLLSGWNLSLERGQIIEVNLEAKRFLEWAAKILKRGDVVTIDYGEERNRLYSSLRHEGTLRCFSRHKLWDDPFQQIGEQDITASVDFSLLRECGEQVGLQTIEFKSQREFMLEQGLLEWIASIAQDESTSSAQLEARLRAKQFLLPGAMGDHFKLLIQRKNCG